MRPIAWAAATLCTLFAGCGGGGGGGGGPTTVTIRSTAGLEGTVFAVAGVWPIQAHLFLGDSNFMTPQGVRAFTSFDLSDLPAGATVTAATLTLEQVEVTNAPYTVLGPVLVDQVVYGSVLDAGAYSRSFPTNQSLGPLSADAVLGPKSLDVRTVIQQAVDEQRTEVQFRLRCPLETNGDAVPEQIYFWSSTSAQSESDRPTLVVTYTR